MSESTTTVQRVRVVSNSGNGQFLTAELKSGETIFDLLTKLGINASDSTVQLQNGATNSLFQTVPDSQRINASDALPTPASQPDAPQHNVSVTPKKFDGATV